MLHKLKNIFNKDGIQTDDDIIRKKRMMSFGVVLLIIVAILGYSYYAFVQKQKKLYANKKQIERGLLDKDERKEDWKARIESDFTELQKQNKELRNQIQSLLKELEKEKKNDISQEEINKLIEEKQGRLSKEIEEKFNTKKEKAEQTEKADITDNKTNKEKDKNKKQVNGDEAKKAKMDILPPPPKPYESKKQEKGYEQYYNKDYVKNDKTSKASTTDTGEEKKNIYVYKPSEASLSKNSSSDNESFYIPSGSFVRGVLLTGVDAPTMQVGKQEPQPVLINLNEETILPNRYRSNMIDCVGIGSARGDLSSERAYIRMVKISCIEEDSERKVVDTSLQGWIMGEDGKTGLRGRLVSKQGSILAKALVAGFAEGVANAFTEASSNISVTPEGSTKTIESDKAFQAAGFEGVGKAMTKLADFYMNMAESMFPVIEVGAGRSVTMVVKNGKSFNLVDKKIKDNPLK